MKIVAIDTTETACSVALLIDDTVIEEFSIAPKQHNQLIFSMMDRLFASSGISIKECDAIAFARGPGSFTGIRIAAATAQGLAVATQLPIIAISSLQALAYQALRLQPSCNILLTGFDARMHQVYWGEYHRIENQAVLVGEERLSALTEVTPSTLEGLCLIGSAWQQAHPPATMIMSEYHVHARDVALAARFDFLAGKLLTPEQAQPVYLRNQITGDQNG